MPTVTLTSFEGHHRLVARFETSYEVALKYDGLWLHGEEPLYLARFDAASDCWVLTDGIDAARSVVPDLPWGATFTDVTVRAREPNGR